MRKVIKILLKLISTALLLLIILPVLLSILLTIPAVQGRLVERATSFASRYMDTKVDISRIDFSALGNIKIHDFYVEDYQRDTLIYANEVNLQIQDLSLRSRKIQFGYGDVSGGVLFLRQEPDSIINITRLVNRLMPTNPSKKSFEIVLDKITASDLDLHIDLLFDRNPEYGVDYGDISLHDITAEVTDFVVNGSAVHAFIKSLSLTEKCGFELLDFTGEMYVNSGIINFENCVMDSRYSHITAPYVSVVGGAWSDYRDFIEKVDIGAKVQNATLSSDDVAYFAPNLRDWGVTITNLDTEFSGEVNNLDISITRSQFEEASSLSTKFNITELPNYNESYITADFIQGQSNSVDISHLYSIFAKKEPQGSLQRYINKLGNVEYSGTIEGKLSDFVSSVDVSTSVGGVKSQLKFKQSDKGAMLDGEVTTDALELGRIFSTSELGRLWMTTKFNTDLSAPLDLTAASGEIDRMELRGEMLREIIYDGNFANRQFVGEVISRNRSMDLDAKGEIDMREERLAYNFDLSLNNIDLKSLKINHKDSISNISARATIKGSGNNIDDIEGDAAITDIKYHYNDSTFVGDTITIQMRSEEPSRSFELNSIYADISYHSQSSYRESWEYLLGALNIYMPAMFDSVKSSTIEHAHNKEDYYNLDAAESYSMLSVEVKDIDPLCEILVGDDLQIAKNSKLDLSYNPATRDISLSAQSQFIELNSVLALYLDLDITNNRDSLELYGSVKELLVGTRQFNDISLLGGVRNNKIEFLGEYNDPETNASTSINALSTLSNDPLRGRMAAVQLLPSKITQGEQMWDVKAHNIEIDKNGIGIDHFVIQNNQQQLLVEGLASRSTSDTVRVDMHNFDLSILSSVTDALGYNVSGVTNGDVVASSALYNMRVEGNIQLDSVSVNTLPAPPMNIRAVWDVEQNQAKVSLTNRIKGDTIIKGYLIPSKAAYYATLEVDSLHLGLLDAPLKGVLSSTKGYANARLSISGERRNAKLEGYADVYDMESRVDYTNVTYRLPSARVEVKDNLLECRNAIVTDTLDNHGIATLKLDLSHLSNISYQVRINVEDFLALDTSVEDNDLFYGKMFATGVVNITGDKAGVNMDITATTDGDSEFYMPLLSKSNISTAEFITFKSPKVAIDSTDIASIKRQSFDNDRRKREARQSNMNITMSLNVTPDASFQLVIDPTVGDVIRGRGEGRINMRVNPKANVFDMYGDYTITEGNYLFTLSNIVNKRFIINPGSTIQWTGDPLDAQLDIEAVYKLKTSLQPLMSDESTRAVPVDCTIFLKDRLLQPDVSFAITLPTGDPEQQATVANLLNDQETISRQFFYLMLANSFISENAANSTSNLGVTTTAATGFELLTNQLSNWLSSSNYNVVIRYRPESELTGDELDFGISRSLVNNRLLVEVEGNYSNNDISASGESEGAASSNFAGEAYITWLIDRSGALRLRGFTQTIDRFDENQGLQETGVGIYYKESFNNFKDLRDRVKARFSRKNVGVRKKDN